MTYQESWAPWVDETTTVRSIAAVDDLWSELNSHDLCVYHLGNDADTYGVILELQRRHPGLVVLHSPSIHQLVAAVLARFHHEPELYLQEMERSGGTPARQAGEHWLAGNLPVGAEPVPLISYLDDSALAVVGHLGPDPRGGDDPHRPPYVFLPLPLADDKVSVVDGEPGGRHLILLTDGEHSPFPLLVALAQNIVHREVPISLATEQGQIQSLTEALEGLQLSPYVRLFTHDDETFQRHLEQALVVVDYRHMGDTERLRRHAALWRRGIPTCGPSPNVGAWPSGWPLIEIRPHHAKEDFAGFLSWLQLAPNSLHHFGLRAAEHTRSLSPERYAEQFVDVARQAAANRIHRTLITARRRTADADPATRHRMLEFWEALAAPPETAPDLESQVRRQADGAAVLGLKEQVRRLRNQLEHERRLREETDDRLTRLEKQMDDLLKRRPLDVGSNLGLAGPTLSEQEELVRLGAFHLWILEVAARFPDGRCLDLRCRRGIWMDLLRQHGLNPAGADQDLHLVNLCREKGFEVDHGDGLAAMERQAAGSHVLISAFEVAERVEDPYGFESWLREALRILRPGGLLLLESQNPLNLGARAQLAQDPGRRRQIHPEALQAQLAGVGFEAVETHMLTHGRPTQAPLVSPKRSRVAVPELQRAFEILNRHLSAAPSFAVVGRKPLLD